MPGPNPAGSTGSESAGVSSTSQLAAVDLALLPGSGTATSSVSYDADDEAVLSTDAAVISSLTCYDGDGNIVETVPPVGVAANSLTVASCAASTLYPGGYQNASGIEYAPASLASDATFGHLRRAERKIERDDARSRWAVDHPDHYLLLRPGGRLVLVSVPLGERRERRTRTAHEILLRCGERDHSTTTTGSGTSAASTTSSCYDPDGDKTANRAWRRRHWRRRGVRNRLALDRELDLVADSRCLRDHLRIRLIRRAGF